ncbi:LacI family DNA-binding transcriptional regulator [Altererythrobacter sp. MTPC7]|uniref:LacI family DNA-binding transcriptional regulator n=1 Tax=Altererythrobacter sp. MTPC7 TaxID=3056567 RepID=UPI0036F3CFF2
MGRRKSGRPTSIDIAYKAGVSQPTVSRALRGDTSVSVQTRERIERIARELNYAVDRNASSLRTQRSDTIALLIFEDPTPDESMINPFFVAMLGSITRACARRGLDLLVSFQRMEDDWHQRYHDSHRADGLILLGYGDWQQYERRLQQLQEQGTSYARWGSVSQDSGGKTIGSDNFEAGRIAGRHLIDGGRRNIAFLGRIDDNAPEFAQRYRGMASALADDGFAEQPGLQCDAITSEEAGRAAMEEVIATGRPFDAVFAASDLIAIGALQVLAERGIAVPTDVAVIGFDNIAAASLTTPPLTTVMQDVQGAGQKLVDTLLAQIEGTPMPDPRMPTRLIVRGSTGG